jgi:hypothetical protein
VPAAASSEKIAAMARRIQERPGASHRRSLSGVALFLLCSLLVGAGLPADGGAGVPLQGLDVRVVADPGRPATAGTPALATATAIVGQGGTIAALLSARGIEPDGDALAVVYLLNPDFDRLSPLAAGTRIVLPALRSGGEGESAPASPLRLRLAGEAKERLLAAAPPLGELVGRVSELPPGRFAQPESRGDVDGALDEILGYLERVDAVVHQRRLPLDPEVVRQSLAEVEAVRSILERWLRSVRPLAAADARTIVRAAEDMNLKAHGFDQHPAPGEPPRRWREVRLAVQAVAAADRKPLPHLQVFYALAALADRPAEARPLPGESPVVAARLPEGDYRLWAVPPGKTPPATGGLALSLRWKEGAPPLAVDLPVGAAALRGQGS